MYFLVIVNFLWEKISDNCLFCLSISEMLSFFLVINN